MSIADHELEEPQDEHEGWCDIHNEYYGIGLCCGGCLDDAYDRMLQDRLDEKGKP